MQILFGALALGASIINSKLIVIAAAVVVVLAIVVVFIMVLRSDNSGDSKTSRGLAYDVDDGPAGVGRNMSSGGRGADYGAQGRGAFGSEAMHRPGDFGGTVGSASGSPSRPVGQTPAWGPGTGQAGNRGWGEDAAPSAPAWGGQPSAPAWGQPAAPQADAWGQQPQRSAPQPSAPAWGQPGGGPASQPIAGNNNGGGWPAVEPSAPAWGQPAAPQQDAWGQPPAQGQRPGAWGQPAAPQQDAWGQPPAADPAAGWRAGGAQPQPGAAPQQPAWGQPAAQQQDAWGQPPQPAAPQADAWRGGSPSVPNQQPPQQPAWGQPAAPQADAWGQPQAAGAGPRVDTRIAYMIVREGKEPGRTYELRKDRISIGRSRESDIFLEDLAVSRLHASIYRDDQGNYVLRDENSANGTTVNGQRASEHRLSEGDEVQVGQTAMTFTRR